jgi:RNase P/RNase MRP subunit POP5
MVNRPKLRTRRRYIAVKIDGGETFDERDIHYAVWTSILRLFGEYGASQTELTLMEFDMKRKQVILRCSHKALDLVKASIVAVTEIANEKVATHILSVSGTLKSLRRRIRKPRLHTLSHPYHNPRQSIN